ncbi:hypothetical protein TNCV_384241 [Trichonephila clavipes]|nr:hypothetical protein TNCV_384241 [Trichonephila clavipes]
MNINVTLYSYSRAFGDGPRNFEPWSSDEEDTWADTPSPKYPTTPKRGYLSSRTDLTCIAPLHDESSVVLGSK